MDQYYDFNSTNGTVIDYTSPDFINSNDKYKDDDIKVTWMWQLTAGWSGSYTSAAETVNTDIWNFQYLVNLITKVST